MTTARADTSFGPESFNALLKDRAGKSTLPSLNALSKVVIDAGHGGKDPGGMGENSREKEIALEIARLLAIGVRTNFPDVEVVMTRTDDTFIPLYERAKIANESGADLFISIHANIMPGKSSTYGTETFVMGQHVAKHNLEVAKRENAVIGLEGNVEQNYGYDPNSDAGHIMMSMFQHAFLERSIQFAELVETEFQNAGRKSRGVKQAGFVVLKETTMPSVLVECGFMSNPTEEAYLLSGVGRQTLVNALLRAFKAYHQRQNGGGGARAAMTPPARRAGTASPTAPAVTTARLAPAAATATNVYDREVRIAPTTSALPTAARQRRWTARGVAPRAITYGKRPAAERTTVAAPRAASPAGYYAPVAAPDLPASSGPLPVRYGSPIPVTGDPSTVLPLRGEAGGKYESVLSREVSASLRGVRSLYERSATAGRRGAMVRDTTPGGYKFAEAKVRKDPKPKTGPDLTRISDDQLLYAVQIIATKRNLDLAEARWRRVPYPIKKISEGGWNKYQVRNLPTAAQARTARARVKASGFNDAMVVVYYRGKRLAAAQVKYLLAR